MRLKSYGRNQKKRKEYIHQSGLLLVGVDVSKSKHDACKTKYNFAKNEDALEWVTYLFMDVPLGSSKPQTACWIKLSLSYLVSSEEKTSYLTNNPYKYSPSKSSMRFPLAKSLHSLENLPLVTKIPFVMLG